MQEFFTGKEDQLTFRRILTNQHENIFLTQKRIYLPTPWEKTRKQFLVESNYEQSNCKL